MKTKFMKVKTLCMVAVLLLSTVTIPCWASVLPIPLPDGETPKPGVWYSDFTALKQFADKEGRPLVLIASSTGCSQCSTFASRVFNNTAFQKWVSEQPYYFCKVQAISGNWSYGEQRAILNTVGGGSLPRFSVYWNRTNYDGQTGVRCRDITVCAFSYDVQKTEDFITKYAGGYVPKPDYVGGGFAEPTEYTVTNGIVTQVEFRLTRDTEFKGVVATNQLVCTLNETTTWTNEDSIVWMDDVEKVIPFELAVENLDYGVTNVYNVSLLDDKGEVRSSATVTALPLPYLGGAFATTSYVVTNGHVVAVNLAFMREDYKKAHVATNRLVTAYYPSGVSTNDLVWDVGTTTLNYELKLDSVRMDPAMTNELEPTLYSDVGDFKGKAHVTVVPYPDFGGEFAVGANKCDRLAVIAGETDAVTIPLVRLNPSQEGTNVLVATYKVQVEEDAFWEYYTNTVYSYSVVTNTIVLTNRSDTIVEDWSLPETNRSAYAWLRCDPASVSSATNRVYDVEPQDYRLDETNHVCSTVIPYETNAWREVEAEGGTVSIPATMVAYEIGTATNAVAEVVKTHTPATSHVETISVTNVVVFAEGEKTAMVTLPLPVDRTGPVRRILTDGEISLTLFKADGVTLAEGNGESSIGIDAVDAESVKNAPANPYWIGERTAETLGWGEWTMDLDAATQKVAAAEGEAYTLILVGGSKWCPDCVNVDRWLLDQPAFAEWARRRNIACVTIDIPRIGETGPSLLSYESYYASERYFTACTNGFAVVVNEDDVRWQSGAAYLARHNVPMEGNGGTNATDIAARNAWLFQTSTEEGGLCRPDCLDEQNEQTGRFKTGVPCLIVKDKTGRVIGRNFQFNNESPEAFKDCYIDRLDELLRQAEDTSEEANDSHLTTTGEMPTHGSIGKSLSYNDVNDWYRVRTSAVGQTVSYHLSGTNDAEVTLSVVQVDGKILNVLEKSTGSLTNGVAVAAKIPSADCFVRVSVPLRSGVATGFFALTNESPTVAAYTLTSDFTLSPTEKVQTYTAEEGDAPSVKLQIEAGRKYKLVGAGGIADDCLEYDEATGLYVARETGSVEVPLVAATLAYQEWNPGQVAFEVTSGVETEPADAFITHTVRVKRRNGLSGIAQIRVEVAEGSTELTEIFAFDEAGAVHTWNEGDNEDWVLKVRVLANGSCDGTQTLNLKLNALEESNVPVDEEKSVYTLTILDDEKTASPGKLCIVSTTPAKAGRYVYAKAGEGVKVELGRVQGTDGTVRGTLTTTQGASLNATEFEWTSRDARTKTAALSLENVKAGSSVNVKLVPQDGARVVSSESAFTVKVIADDAPTFEEEKVSYTIYKSVAMHEKTVAVDNVLAGTVKATKIAGTLPAGIKAAYDATRKVLVFSGVPTARAGMYETVYQVSTGSVKGLVLGVTFTVVDPVKPSAMTGEVLNEACAKARTFRDLQVYDAEDLGRLIGLVTLTVPPSGRVSAKYASASGTVSLVAKNWSEIGADNALTAELQGTTMKTKDYSMTVTAKWDGTLVCTLRDAEEKRFVLTPNAAVCAPLDGNAAAWEGYYTASLAQKNPEDASILAKGDGYLTLRMTSKAAIAKGRMAYAGVLPNGKAFTGSRTLWGYYHAAFEKTVLAYLPVFNTSSSDDVSGLVLITQNAKAEHLDSRRSVYNGKTEFGFFDANRFIWTSKEGRKAGRVYEAKFDVYGGIYDETEDFAGCCIETFTTELLTFFAMPQFLDETVVWSTDDTQVSAAPLKKKVGRTEVEVNNLALVSQKNAQGLTLAFNRATGVVSGTFNLAIDGQTVRTTYKGIVLPGWGRASCSDCSAPSETQKRPFVSGTCFFKQNETYKVGSGNLKTVRLTSACPFSIGLEEVK